MSKVKNGTYHPRGELVDGYKVRNHPSYMVWVGIKSRCNDVNTLAYKNYGGRGITYCDEWEHFANFARDVGIKPTSKHTIERIDNDGNYTKSNCKWATKQEQSSNRRRFLNNSTGYTGVKLVKKSGRYVAAYNHFGKRYAVSGTFKTPSEAAEARSKLIKKILNEEPYEHMLERKARYDSSTGVRGISKHQDGGYLVRVTHNGVRVYLGYFKLFECAKRSLDQWKDEYK